MHIAFGAAPSRLCSRIYLPTLLFPPPVSFATIVYLFCRTPHYVCVLLHQPRCHPAKRWQCKLILSCIKRRKAHSSCPAATSLPLDLYLYLYFSISLISHSLASNDIYAILIEYLLYMRLHIQAFPLPLPSNTVPHTLTASLQCL